MNTQNWNQGTLLQMSGQYWQTCTLHTGIKLDIFTEIGSHRPTGDQIADQLNMDARGIVVLLDALSAMGLLSKSGGAGFYPGQYKSQPLVPRPLFHQYVPGHGRDDPTRRRN